MPLDSRGLSQVIRTSQEIRALLVHSVCVAILLGFDLCLKRILPAPDPHHPAGVWLHHVLDWGAVTLVAALTWICLMMLLLGVVDSTRDVIKRWQGGRP